MKPKKKKKNPLEFEISFYERIVEQKPDYEDALSVLAEAYTAVGEYSKGLEMDVRLASLKPEDPVVLYNLACSYALMKKKEESLTTLERAVAYGYDDFDHMVKDQDLKIISHDPRFKKILKKALVLTPKLHGFGQ